MTDQDKTFMLTDSCMWEANRITDGRAPHAIEVVDMQTGQIRFIKSGSTIKFVEGEITDPLSQEGYNEMKDMELEGKQSSSDGKQPLATNS